MNRQERMKVTRSSQMDARTSRNSVLDGVPNNSFPWIRDCRTRNMTAREGRAGIEEDEHSDYYRHHHHGQQEDHGRDQERGKR